MEKRKNIQRGQVKEMIISALKSGDKYGYQIIKEIFDTTGGKVEIKQPTLYNSLKVLESEGLISSYDGKETLGGKRKYFKLTKKGMNSLPKEELNNNPKEEKEVQKYEYKDIMLPKPEKVEIKVRNEEKVEEIQNKPTELNIEQNDVINVSLEMEKNNDSPKFKAYDDPNIRRRSDAESENEKEEALNVLYNPNQNRIPTKEEKQKVDSAPLFKTYPENNSYKILEEIDNRNKLKNTEEKPQPKPVKINKENAEHYKSILDKLVDTRYIRQEIIKTDDRIETNEEKLIAESISIKDLQAKANAEGYSLKYHEKRLGNNFSLIYKNKASLLTTLFLFIIGTLELVGYYLLFQEKLMINNFSYVLLEGIFVVALLYSFFKYIFNRKRKTRPTFKYKQTLLTTLIISINLIVVWIAICLIFFDFSFKDQTKVLIQMVLPIMYIILIPLYPIIYSGVSRMKIMYS